MDIGYFFITVIATYKHNNDIGGVLVLIMFGAMCVGINYVYNRVRMKYLNKIKEEAEYLAEIKYRESLYSLNKEIEEKKAIEQEKLNKEKERISDERERLNELHKTVFKTVEECKKGYPYLANKIAEATDIICENNYQRREMYRFRDALKTIETLRGIIAYHEFIYPELKDSENEDDNELKKIIEKQKNSDELQNWLTKEEYLSLPDVEKNQKALDRYKEKVLSKWEIGKMYERYIGFLYEAKGYKVDYDGIKYKLEDRGRDLICTKGEKVLIIQCKNWSSSKTIYEKHIFQFFGTVFYARMEENRIRPLAPKSVKGLFFTTTQLSDYAIEAAKLLDIKIINMPLDKDYPCIKCNIGKDGERIYHLPFDQQYDSTKIAPNKNEFYARTCKEAEAAGFRRAKRFLGNRVLL